MNRSKLVIILLCFTLLFSACGNAAETPDETKVSAPVTRGRYLEQDVDFPVLRHLLALEQVAPETFYLLGWDGDVNILTYLSEDSGETWQETAHADLSDYHANAGGGFSPDGSFYISYMTPDPADSSNTLFHTARVDETGVTDIPELSEYYTGFLSTPSGKLVIDRAFSFLEYDPETGETEEYELATGQTFGGNYALSGEKLAAMEDGEITIFDLAGGDTKAVKLTEGTAVSSALAAQEDGSGFFYANRSGLYRVTMDGAITEQLIDGALAGFGMPSVYLMKLFACTDGSFLTLVQNQDDSYQLSRYVFDPEASREPSKELTVFSLRDDTYIRQVVGMYQKANPDVMVKLEPALPPEESAITPADAIRTLSTELLAGNGPDLFVLDGLPIDSYIRQNALADLAPTLEGVKAELLPTPANAYAYGDGLYAIPARMSAWLLAGIGTEEITSLSEFVDWLGAQPTHEIGMPPEALPEMLYPTLAANWFGADGSLDTAALSSDLTELERLAGLLNEDDALDESLEWQSLFWAGEKYAAVFGRLGKLENLAFVTSAFTARGGGSMKLFPDGGSLLPSSILGVNAAGGQLETSLDFVRFALSGDAQKTSFDSGMPVSRVALEAVAVGVVPGEANGSLSLSKNDTGERYELDTNWPTVDQFDGVIEQLAAVTRIAPNNEVVRQMVLEETAGLFTGDKTVDEVVAALSEKVERYLQE